MGLIANCSHEYSILHPTIALMKLSDYLDCFLLFVTSVRAMPCSFLIFPLVFTYFLPLRHACSDMSNACLFILICIC